MLKESDVIIFGHGSGTPSKKNLVTYSTSRQSKDRGIVCVRRLKNLTKKKKELFQKACDILEGRNTYSQDRREYVFKRYSDGKFYSDCSMIGMAMFDQLGYRVGSLNTAGIYYSDMFEDVPVKLKNGHITNPGVLRVGDCILFKGSDPSRPKQIGHVEYVYSREASE